MADKIRYRLSSPKEIRKVLAKITNQLANNEIDPKKANTIAYLCNCILQSIRVDELEKQIQELEDLVSDK
ncbi:hypothetical protein H8S10_05010 [Clostridium sp. NSJ-49]|uniref:hypothetical protein n=1 Tax=Clostridium TaxID=1485 RepID=UPI00164A311B|nr:hypothetical protein [Clostridium sp. NSJ-49]MBC5624813.1 hypothetical protein [Clostridium sp. NSJ-49]